MVDGPHTGMLLRGWWATSHPVVKLAIPVTPSEAGLRCQAVWNAAQKRLKDGETFSLGNVQPEGVREGRVQSEVESRHLFGCTVQRLDQETEEGNMCGLHVYT